MSFFEQICLTDMFDASVFLYALQAHVALIYRVQNVEHRR